MATPENRMHQALQDLEQDVLWVERDLTLSFATANLPGLLKGPVEARTPFPDMLAIPRSTASALRTGALQCFENMLPLDMCLSLFPEEMSLEDGRVLGIKPKARTDAEGNLATLVLLLTDITETVSRHGRELKELEYLRSIFALLTQRPMLEIFLSETTRLLEQLAQAASLDEGKRILHTLKGNSASLGLKSLSGRIHDLESAYLKSGGGLSLSQNAAREVSLLLHEFLLPQQQVLQMDLAIDPQGLLKAQVSGTGVSLSAPAAPREESAQAQTPLETLMQQFEGTVRQVSARLNKRIHFRSSGATLPIRESLVMPIASELIHIIRNCCDHGIERPHNRDAVGKFPEGLITFRVDVLQDNTSLEILIRDDGAGIRGERLRDKAVENGLLTSEQAARLTPEETLELIFADGLSTAEKVTSISGRGVGLAALKHAVESAGGTLGVTSEPGQGTCFRIVIPNGHDATSAKERIFIPWNESFAVKVDSIDEQHKHLVELVNRAARTGGRVGELNDILDELLHYTQEHFSSEEKLMADSAYPGQGDHSREHRELLESVIQFAAKLDHDQISGLAESLLNFLKEWLLCHIASSDKAFGRFLHSRNPA